MAMLINDNTKGGGPGEVWLLCGFYDEPLRTWNKNICYLKSLGFEISLKGSKKPAI